MEKLNYKTITSLRIPTSNNYYSYESTEQGIGPLAKGNYQSYLPLHFTKNIYLKYFI